jgi:hypothetical protein
MFLKSYKMIAYIEKQKKKKRSSHIHTAWILLKYNIYGPEDFLRKTSYKDQTNGLKNSLQKRMEKVGWLHKHEDVTHSPLRFRSIFFCFPTHSLAKCVLLRYFSNDNISASQTSSRALHCDYISKANLCRNIENWNILKWKVSLGVQWKKLVQNMLRSFINKLFLTAFAKLNNDSEYLELQVDEEFGKKSQNDSYNRTIMSEMNCYALHIITLKY